MTKNLDRKTGGWVWVEKSYRCPEGER